MIVTLTPAPAIDWTAHVDSFTWGAVNRIGASSREPSGKGLNVSWALHRAGVATTAVFPGGGGTAEFMASTLREAGLDHVLVPTEHEVRTNLTLVTGGEATKVNEPGFALTDQQATALVDDALAAARAARAVLLCGSHPAGFTSEHVGRLAAGARALGVDCVLDTSGPALAQAVALDPDLIKPNVHELADLCGKELCSIADVVAAAREVCARGTRAVLASLGADGAVHHHHRARRARQRPRRSLRELGRRWGCAAGRIHGGRGRPRGPSRNRRPLGLQRRGLPHHSLPCPRGPPRQDRCHRLGRH